MQKIISIVILTTIFSFPVKGQIDSSGIYENADDFVARKLTYGGHRKMGKHKLLLNNFFNRPFITVIHNDTVHNILRNDIFGYRLQNGAEYRIVHRHDLRILNAAEYIIIYRRDVTHPPSGKTNVTNYYFSIGPYSSVQKLTIKNLKKGISSSQLFLEEIDGLFKYNTELAAYDKQHKMYVINWIYKKSVE
ncbi:MAG: hypothetical protein EKK37_04260 [Sphingobacteriales bacterium]|nr:MAG: hypothetical protein EKK37_04260 [Sphingobacteriales bacterium]